MWSSCVTHFKANSSAIAHYHVDVHTSDGDGTQQSIWLAASWYQELSTVYVTKVSDNTALTVTAEASSSMTKGFQSWLRVLSFGSTVQAV